MKINRAFYKYLTPILIFVFFFSFYQSLHAQNYTSVSSDFQFTRNLGLGNRGQDVENLQCILGVTDPTGYYGSITSAAVLQFQNAHVAEILTPVGLTSGTGYFGTATRTYINIQIHNASSTSSVVPTCPTYIPPTPEPQPTPIPPPYQYPPQLPLQPQPTPTQSPNQQLPLMPFQQQNQQLPLIPFMNQNGGLSYYNPNSQPVLNPQGQFTAPNSANPYDPYNVTSSYQNPNLNQYQNPVFSNTTPPHVPLNTNDQAFYTLNANSQAIQAYQAGGDCSQHPNYQNCASHPNYYTTHVAYPERICAIHPTIAYLEQTLLPRVFSWIKIGSDCRMFGQGVGPGDVHALGWALDLGSKNGGLTQAQGDEIVFWARKPENSIIGLTIIIYNHHFYRYNPQTSSWSDEYPKCDIERDIAGDDPCHVSHVHFGIN